MSKENFYLQEKTEINLNALEFDFCNDDFIKNYYEKKISEIADKKKWIETHSNSLAKEQKRIEKAVELGIIPDARAETIWEFNVNKLKNASTNAIETKNKLEKQLDQILENIQNRLNTYLPNWKAQKAKIKFGMYERADFRIDFDTIFVDLGRLQFADNTNEELINGLSHELFHLWFSENIDWSDDEINKYSNEQIKQRGIYKIIDEGLAVLISGQSLEEHHEKQGTNYQGI